MNKTQARRTCPTLFSSYSSCFVARWRLTVWSLHGLPMFTWVPGSPASSHSPHRRTGSLWMLPRRDAVYVALQWTGWILTLAQSQLGRTDGCSSVIYHCLSLHQFMGLYCVTSVLGFVCLSKTNKTPSRNQIMCFLLGISSVQTVCAVKIVILRHCVRDIYKRFTANMWK